jgi:pimeloyl-ACP methyl ester carboxylesterase
MKIAVNGTELYYEVIGSGEPLLMVHGNSEDHTIFTEAAEVLKDYYTCYLVDTRSHGKSSKVKRLHYRDMARDYMEFIKALDLKNVTFFGFSDGGILGLLIGMESDLVDTLVVSGANTYPGAVVDKMARIMKLIYIVTGSDKFRLMLKEPDIRAEDLQKIRCKTFVLAGSEDAVKQENTDFIAANIPNSTEVILEGETHTSHIVHNTKIAEIILELTGKK